MDARYWDGVAGTFEKEIFNVFQSDRTGELAQQIHANARTDVACDFGCGTGRAVPAIAARAKKVFAVDLSPRCLAVAQAACESLDNVTWMQRDLAAERGRFCRAGFGLAVNVLIMPRYEIRDKILGTMAKNLRPGARLLIVVPSLEAVLATYSALVEWHRRDGVSHRKAVRRVHRLADDEMRTPIDGIVRIDGVKTKHFLRDEALRFLRAHGFRDVETYRLEHAWKEELDNPPRWLREPYPWHWLFVATRRGRPR